jgi:hypothetical protein
MRNRRRTALVALVALVVVGLAGVLISAGTKSSAQVQSVGVLPVYPLAPIVQGATACQGPFGITESFDRVRFNVGAFGSGGPPLTVIVRDGDSRAELGSGEVAAGWVDNGSAQNVEVGSIPTGHRVAVCVRNDGPTAAYVYGDFYNGKFGLGPLGVTPTNTSSFATIDRYALPDGDLSMALVRSSERSLLARIPAMFQHASPFHPGIVGPWTYWVLAALILFGAPFALWRALARAGAGGGSPDDRRYPDSSRP